MENEFKKISLLDQRKLSMEELCKYKRAERKAFSESDKKLKGVTFRKVIHPIINFLIKQRRLQLNQTLTVWGEVPKQVGKKRPIIFAITHTGKYDIEIVNEAIKKSYYLLSDDEEYMYRTVDGYFTAVNGCIYVDNDYHEDTISAKKIIDKALMQGANVMWYPESIWNLSPNELILPFKFGVIDSAIRTNALILPIAIDQQDKDFYVNIGEYIYPEDLPVKSLDDKEGKIKAATLLRDKMATLKWDLFAQQDVTKRETIPEDFYEKFVDEKIAEWPYLTRQTIEKRVFKPPYVTTIEDVYSEPLIRKHSEEDLENRRFSKVYELLEQYEQMNYDEAYNKAKVLIKK